MKEIPIDKIIASFEGKLSETGQKELGLWLSTSEKNRLHFNELKKTYDSSTKKLTMNFEPDANKALKKINQQIKTKRIIRSVWKAAAAIILLVLASQFILRTQSTGNWHEITAQQRQTVFLPDSSKVILAKNTTLTFPETFKENKRKVYLNGTAYFEITQNPEKPFQINATSTEIEVLGTKFLVDAAQPDKESVAVDEGKVAFSFGSLFTREKIILTEDEIGTWNADTKKITKEINQQQNSNTWLSGNFNFREQTLSEILKTLEQHFRKKIELSNKDFGLLRLSGKFSSDDSLEKIIETICLTLNLSYEKNENMYIIKP
jgi:ferric-dicitrate binding protein FerR (iron transport regulator)